MITANLESFALIRYWQDSADQHVSALPALCETYSKPPARLLYLHQRFQSRTVFNFCHSTSPTYILYFIVCTWNDLICTSPTFYSSVQNQTSARVSSGAHFTFAVRFFCTPVATIQCFYGIILQIGLKWNSLLFWQLARLSALYMPADILLDSCAAVEHIP